MKDFMDKIAYIDREKHENVPLTPYNRAHIIVKTASIVGSDSATLDDLGSAWVAGRSKYMTYMELSRLKKRDITWRL